MNNIVYIVTLPEYGHIIPVMNYFFEHHKGVACMLVPKGFKEKVMRIMDHAFPQVQIEVREIGGDYLPPETFTTYTVFTHFHSTLPFLVEVKNFLFEKGKKESFHVIIDAVLEYILDQTFLKKVPKVEIVHAILPIFLRTCLRYHVKLTNIFGKAILVPKNFYKLLKLFIETNKGKPQTILLRNFHKNFLLPRYIYIDPKLSSGIAMPKNTKKLLPVCSRTEDVPELLRDFLKKYSRIIYVSFGTVFPKSVSVYEDILSCASQDVGIVISCKDEQVANLKEAFYQSANVYIGASLPQLTILRQTFLMVTHGGYNTINEALHFDVPLVLLPHMYEQELNAKIVEAKGLGKIVEASEKGISEALVKLLNT